MSDDPSPAPEQSPAAQLTAADAARSEHLPDCEWDENCECFGKYYSHKQIYAMQQEIARLRLATRMTNAKAL